MHFFLIKNKKAVRFARSNVLNFIQSNLIMSKKRILVDYQNVPHNVLELIQDKFPFGFDELDLIKYKNSKGETVKSIPIETEENYYLVKTNIELQKKLDNFDPSLPEEEIDVARLENIKPQEEKEMKYFDKGSVVFGADEEE